MLNSNGFSKGDAPVGVSLDELFPEATRTGAGGVAATSCSTDWRQVEPGDVFVAVPEAEEDNSAGAGHEHACRAVSHGAIAVVCEQPVPVFDAPTYLVSDSRIALGELSHALVGNPTLSLPTIGIAGTHGKSTTLALLESIFSSAGKHCGTLSSLGCYDGMTCSEGLSNAPTSPALASRLARMDAAGCTHALVEVSSRSLSQYRTAGMTLDAVCVTNVTDAHLNHHASIQNYRNAQRRILDYLSPGGVTVLNADDPESVRWLDQVQGPVLTYGMGDQAEITAQVIERHSNEQIFLLSVDSESAAVRSAIVGEHHVANCLAAAATALAYGVDLQTIAAGIEAVDRLPGRMERIDCGQGFPVYVDAASTPGALRASLRTARQLARGRVICVLGEHANGSSSNNYEIANIIHRMTDLTIVPSSMQAIESGEFENETSTHIEVVADRSEAIACAVAMAEAGDVVVIVGSQPRTHAAFGGGEDDVQIARQLLYARNGASVRLAA